MKDEIYYKCDPNKNNRCNKRRCKYNPNSKYPVCDMTINKKFSVDDIPIAIDLKKLLGNRKEK